jgi:hypothetical protein
MPGDAPRRRDEMMLQLHGMLLPALAMLAAWLMTQSGLAKRALELRHPPRLCPSCGRESDRCRCTEQASPDD